ncbi:MAG: UDP-3-O-(3-hydroxymyristoyl)glucosamine N-acyltransferase [Leptothrix sp. (in: b-proteobacteria)]
MLQVTLHDIHAALGGELVGDASIAIARIAALASADAQSISFISSARYRAQLADTAAACVIVMPELAADAAQRSAVIVTPEPYLYYARLSQWWAQRQRVRPPAGVHPSAVVAADVQLGAGASIGALAVVEAGAVIGVGAQIGAQCHVGAGVQVGEGTRLAPQVTLMPGTRLGARCILHSGVVIGADGFGFAPTQGRWDKIEQLGGVVIGDDVEIGANTCIDRGALDDTVIGTGVKLDNLIQIAHNVQIGDHSAMAGCAGVAGSARIGRGCTIGGAANILGHLELADGVHISAASVVMSSIKKPGLYSGIFPIDDNASWEKNAATLRHLHALRDRLRTLEKKSNT